ncbi:MAG: tetraacyldisaccharide 4'-kinase [Syntrophobacteraceae bacterium]
MNTIATLGAKLYKETSRKIQQTWYCDTRASSVGEGGAQVPAVLKVASLFYEKGLRKDQESLLRGRVKLCAPVISIGNLTVGGTGKTPLTIWICEFLLASGFHPAVLTRGYGRRGKSPGRIPVCCDESLWELFGDEPVMMSQYLPQTPVWVGANRAVSGEAAIACGGVDVLVLDDGFQHLRLERDLDIVLLDCRNPFGNGLVLPAGPLREPVSSLKRAQGFVITHAGEKAQTAHLKKRLENLFPGTAVFACNHRLKGIRLKRAGPLLDPCGLAGKRAVAFAAIASPQSFFDDLQRAGLRLCQTFDFPDHHRYASEELLEILGSASAHRTGLIVTTAKDFARVPPYLKDAFAVAEIGIEFGCDGDAFGKFIEKRLKGSKLL